MLQQYHRRSRRRIATWRTLLATILVLALALGGSSVLAVHDEAFELDGNIADNTGNTQVDWASLFDVNSGVATAKSALPAGFIRASFQRDFVPGSGSDSTTFTTGSKDTLNITPGWQCSRSNNLGDKFDMLNIYAAAYQPSGLDDLIVYFGQERASNSGDANVGFWFLQDSTVGCTATGGGNFSFTGTHLDGDLLLTSGYSNGGTIPTIEVYRWNGGANGALGQSPIYSSTAATCSSASANDIACAMVNAGNLTPPWLTQPKGGGTSLAANQFFEGGLNVTEALEQAGGGAVPCFATFLADTRSSTSPTATIFDFALASFPTCGQLQVKKYIDVDADGVSDAGDVTSGTAVSGWSFSVTGPNGLPDVVCSGATDSTGTLNCSNLPPGNYVVTETQQGGYVNTDPGPLPANVSVTVSDTATVTFGGTNTIDFGNTCYIAKTFQVTGVPAGQSGLFAWYKLKAGSLGATSPESQVNVSLALSNGTASATVNNTFIATSVIDWGFGIDLNTPGQQQVTVESNEGFQDGAYPACAKTNTVAFPTVPVNGLKFKDINGNGTQDPGTIAGGTESGLANFQFQLKSGATVLQTATSDTGGAFTFSNVAPGSYTVHELPQTGWVQTTPAGDSSLTVTLAQAYAGAAINVADKFGNTPLSDISVTFTPQTNPAVTNATITCTDASGTTVGAQTANTYTATGLQIKQSVLTCTITITDP